MIFHMTASKSMLDIVVRSWQSDNCHFGRVVMWNDDDWVKKCMEYEVEGPRPRGRPKRSWREVVREDCQARKMNKEDAIDHCKWRKTIKDVRWSGWVWVGECFFWYRPTRVVPDQRPLNGCVCVVVWAGNCRCRGARHTRNCRCMLIFTRWRHRLIYKMQPHAWLCLLASHWVLPAFNKVHK